MYNNAIFVSKLSDIPKVKHWAIFLNDTYSTPGWNQGDPSATDNKIEYRAYLKKEDWEAAIRELIVPPQWSSQKAFKVAEINPIEVKFDLKLAV